MSNAEVRLEATINTQRKAALARGGAIDHSGRVRVAPMASFDMGRTIFGELEGVLPRFMMKAKLANDVFWSDPAIAEVEAAYRASEEEAPSPPLDQALVDFMVDECDFSMEHADGTFLEHLIFCHDYAAKHYPDHSPNVALLHSILGTATNTFAMDIKKFPKLKEHLTDFEAQHIEAFPSILRLFYDGKLLPELRKNIHKLDRLEAIHCYRVIDNMPLELDAENLWVQLNYHLMHFVDFMPTANWGARLSDPLMQQFEALSSFLDDAGKREAKVEVCFPASRARPVGEKLSAGTVIAGFVPPEVNMRLARKTIGKYSEKIGHDTSYRLVWS